MERRLIAFTGPKESGKDTLAKCLFSQNTPIAGKYFPFFMRQPFSYGVKSICKSTFGWSMEQQDDPVFKETCLEEWPRIEPRWAMMDIANFMREKYGPDVWVHALESRLQIAEKEDPHGAYVITDLRFPNEIDYLLRHNALIIYVQRDKAEKALKEAQARGDEKALNPSEAYYALMREKATVVLDNNGNIHQGHAQVFKAVRSHFGGWSTWGVGQYVRNI